MNGSDDKKETERFVVDTNVIFMSLYNPESKAGKIIQLAEQGKIILFSTDFVKEELRRTLMKELNLDTREISSILESLPISWTKKELYEDYIGETKVKHKADKQLEALSLALNCRILSADKHFKTRVNVNEILQKYKV